MFGAVDRVETDPVFGAPDHDRDGIPVGDRHHLAGQGLGERFLGCGCKARRGERVPLHPVVVEQLWKIVDFGELVFPWPHHERTLWSHFAKVEQAAGIHLPCHEDHDHTDACHVYGFHDLRRAFATMNADRLTGDALQALMRHRSYQTT